MDTAEYNRNIQKYAETECLSCGDESFVTNFADFVWLPVPRYLARATWNSLECPLAPLDLRW